jgi:hypothetical protein
MLLKKLAHLRFASDVLDKSITLNWLLPPFVLDKKKFAQRSPAKQQLNTKPRREKKSQRPKSIANVIFFC